MKIIATTTEKLTIKTYRLSLGDRLLSYIEHVNDKGSVVDCNLRDVDGDEIGDAALLEQVEEFVDSLGENKPKTGKQSEFTVTITANRHINAHDEDEALALVRDELPDAFDLIEDEVKPSADSDDDEPQRRDEKNGLYSDRVDVAN